MPNYTTNTLVTISVTWLDDFWTLGNFLKAFGKNSTFYWNNFLGNFFLITLARDSSITIVVDILQLVRGSLVSFPLPPLVRGHAELAGIDCIDAGYIHKDWRRFEAETEVENGGYDLKNTYKFISRPHNCLDH